MALYKTDVEGLYRDSDTKAILNTDNKALSAYKIQKQRAKELDLMKERIEKIDRIEEEIDQINDKLLKILERLNAGYSS